MIGFAFGSGQRAARAPVRTRRPAGPGASLARAYIVYTRVSRHLAGAALVRATRYGGHSQSRAPHADCCLDMPVPRCCG